MEGTVAEVPFHNNIISKFLFYKDRLETKLLQRFAHRENSEWFSIISGIIFEFNIVAEQKQAQMVTIFLFFINFHCLQLFYCPAPPALPLLRRP